MTSMVERIAATISSFFQLGGLNGPGISNNANNIEAKNPTNTGFVNVRAASPIIDADLATKAYVDTGFGTGSSPGKPIPVGLQLSGAVALPNNSATEQYYVVTTTGGVGPATIGQLFWDDGQNTATPVVPIGPAIGGTIIITAPLTGGTISFPAANQLWVWNGTPTPQWNLVTGSSSTGGMSVIDFPIGLTTVSSVTSLPAGAIVYRADVTITTPYNAVVAIAVGTSASPTLFQAILDNQAITPALYSAPQRTPAVNVSPVLATITGPATTGSGFVSVLYSVPNP